MSEKINNDLLEIEKKRIHNAIWMIDRNHGALKIGFYTYKYKQCYHTTDMTDIENGNIRLGDVLKKERINNRYKLIGVRTEMSQTSKIKIPSNCPKCQDPLTKVVRPRSEKNASNETETLYLCTNTIGCEELKIVLWLRMERKVGLMIPEIPAELKRKLLSEPFIRVPLDIYDLIKTNGAMVGRVINRYTQDEKETIKRLVSKLPRVMSLTQFLFVLGYPTTHSKLRKITEFCGTFDAIEKMRAKDFKCLSDLHDIHFTESEVSACVEFIKRPAVYYAYHKLSKIIEILPTAKMKLLIRYTKDKLVFLHGTARNTESYGHWHDRLESRGCLFTSNIDDAKVIFVDNDQAQLKLSSRYRSGKAILNIKHLEAIRDTTYPLY